jgi:predicted dehydrogenase
MRETKAAVIGLGFMGKVHCENIRRLPYVKLQAIVTRNEDTLRRYQAMYHIPEAYTDWKDLLKSKGIDVVHNCTPNSLHYPINKAFLERGIAIISEKPLTVNLEEAKETVELAEKRGIFNAICFNYRFFPVVQEMKAMIGRGELGEVRIIQGGYLQDWLLYDTDYNWRVKPGTAKTRTIADLGSHWIDLAQYLSGKRALQVMADLETFVKFRKRPKEEGETFQLEQPEDYELIKIDTEDYGAVLIHFEGGARGNVRVSQVSPGRKNRLEIEICGSQRSLYWNLEEPNHLWIGCRDGPNLQLMDDPNLLSSRKYSLYPGGHNEGWGDAQRVMLAHMYQAFREGSDDYPGWNDGLRAMQFEESAYRSSREGKWIEINAPLRRSMVPQA